MSGRSGRVGWGGSRFGGFAWGGARALGLQLSAAVAVAENVVRLRFTQPVRLTGIFDVGDAADPSHYAFAPSATSSGLDGTPARAVLASSAAYSAEPLPGPDPRCFVDVVLDRPLTPYPSVYAVVVSGVATLAGQPIDPTAASLSFIGSFKQVVPADATSPHPARDFANPQTLAALTAAASGAPAGALSDPSLGAFAVDVTGDYALDQGLQALKKRIYRRLTSRPGAFLHLGEGYGVGIPAAGKKLASAATLGRMASKAEEQISLEPEVAQVKVRALSQNTGLVRFVVLVRTRAGVDSKFEAVFPIR